MSKRSKPTSPINDDADRAMTQIHAAVRKLIEIAGATPTRGSPRRRRTT
jgi:hypothetical protein